MKKLTIPELWKEYQTKLKNGIDEPYIKSNDFIVIHDSNYLIANGNIYTEADNLKLKYAGCKLQIKQSRKVDNDLWYHYAICENGQLVTLADEDIKIVYRKTIGV